MYERARFLPCGDKALLVEFGNAISREANTRVRNMFLAVEKQGVTGVVDLVPTYRSVLVYYDPLRVSRQDLTEQLARLEQHLEEVPVEKPKVVEVPTVYGGEYGPDLGTVAQHNKLAPDEVVQVHAGTDYLVYMIGFTPGFPYLGGMSPKIATPRLKTPRTVIPAGSVGIAESQTGIYPLESPGGWQLIGRTPIKLFDPYREPPAILQPGDYVRFVRITDEEYRKTQAAVAAGTYQARTHLVE
ncbi:MAG: 5-oxoprolinase subunit PxpB [Chloroflexi bacterium]|nr:5-oxoprolinase subunit PxpB [Chloroflexota bacterium]